MLIPPQTDLVMLGLAAIGLVGTLAYVIRGGRLFWVIVGGGIYTAIATAAAIVTIACSCYGVRVTGEGQAIHGERVDLLFSTTLSLGGKDVHISASDGRSVIINDTDKPLRLHGEVYATSAYLAASAPDDKTIPPRSAVGVPVFVDNLGPGDPLPREVSAEATESEVTKYWLTW